MESVTCSSCGYNLKSIPKQKEAKRYTVCPRCGMRLEQAITVEGLSESTDPSAVSTYSKLLEDKNG